MDYSFPINEKIRLLALKSLLSARLFEEKIILIEDEHLEKPKTLLLNEILKPFGVDKLLFVTGFETQNNFLFAQKNIPNVKLLGPQ
mmetsp:Transcript_24052/g.18347  ORF Transcript_24052/g.18347 Transcript_24052/m.18347 type:complete len:86 (+) Transcript_24052:493-750(+)